MTRFLSPTVWASIVAVLLGVGAQYAWGISGAGYKCSAAFNVTCPATGICQPPLHCGITANHKCVNVAPNDSFRNCYVLLGNTCAPSLTGCKFEDWTGPGCIAATGVITAPLCYSECL
jgi:hypothetical protein